MQLSPIYEQRLAEAKQEGRQEGKQEGVQTERRTTIKNLFRVRFGALDNEQQAIVEPLLALPPEEFTFLLLELSHDDLLTRFYQH